MRRGRGENQTRIIRCLFNLEFFLREGQTLVECRVLERDNTLHAYVLVVQTRGGEKTPKFGRCVQIQCGGVDANSSRPPLLRWERGRNLTSQERKWRWERSAEGAHSFSPHPVLGFNRSVRIIAPGAARKRGRRRWAGRDATGEKRPPGTGATPGYLNLAFFFAACR